MNITKISSSTAINNQNKTQKNTNFQAKLSLSREASKTLAEKAKELGIIANNGIADGAARMKGNQIASYIDSNINYLARKIKPIEPEDFPIVFDLSHDYKNFLKRGGKRQDFEKNIEYYGDQADPMFELCPNGTHLNDIDYHMAFNLHYDMLNYQMERLYYAIKERMDILFGRLK